MELPVLRGSADPKRGGPGEGQHPPTPRSLLKFHRKRFFKEICKNNGTRRRRSRLGPPRRRPREGKNPPPPRSLCKFHWQRCFQCKSNPKKTAPAQLLAAKMRPSQRRAESTVPIVSFKMSSKTIFQRNLQKQRNPETAKFFWPAKTQSQRGQKSTVPIVSFKI